MSLRANLLLALVLLVAALLAVLLGSSTLRVIGGVVAVMIVMVVVVDLILPSANRLHWRYRGRWGVKSYGDRRIASDEPAARRSRRGPRR